MTVGNLSKEEFIARVRHIAWVAYQIGAGQDYNLEINEDQMTSLMDGVRFALENPGMTPEENHENWMRMKQRQGWVLGPVKDFARKTHPDLVPYGDLPVVEAMKDTMDQTSHRMALALLKRINGVE